MDFEPEKCLKCCWSRFLGDRIFCPFQECEQDNRVFKNGMFNGGKVVKKIGGAKFVMINKERKL